ncbi:hypothetical protein C1T31_06065 [Hanstruepera neustonica]|uniref:SGNH/GDSL hydrolase family protein n=1 Tax=Hanstruepera neustonica TaxID=1445657 RepID=A0A2K1E0S8_9FLAO|nr:hypothetical protein [Hanstruepera neustonica]PNQ73890.1 hypothetical protein C1T31_06065 [Hanstruepera neustonica]
MKKFIKNSVILFGIVMLLVVSLVLITHFVTRQFFDYTIDQNKNILVVGNSHLEYAIDDDIIPQAFNIAQSGSGYFYSYLKVREIANRNKQIDTVVLGYSYEDFSEYRVNWFAGEDKIKFKMRDHFFLFTSNDYWELLKSNPRSVITNTPQVIVHSLKVLYKGYPYLGGHVHSDRSKLEESLKRYDPNYYINTTAKPPKYQDTYLLKIYDYCNRNNIKLILLNSPIHPKMDEDLQTNKELYCDFASQNMPEATLINYSNYFQDETYFSDISHLNDNGAQIFSTHLKQVGFYSGTAECLK